MLARQWVDYAFRTLWDRRLWSWMRKQTQFLINQVVVTGTVDVTRGALDVQGHNTNWDTGSLIGRQFRVGTQNPLYTIISGDDGAQTLTLDAPWAGSTLLGGGYEIYNAFVTPPTDFLTFISVWDSFYNWQLQLNVSQVEINLWDAQRTNAGQAYVVSQRDYDPFNSPPLPRFELWPHQKAQYNYQALYISRPPDLSDPAASLPRYIRGDVLLEMALAQAARWPGPSMEQRNIYFNLALAMQHDARAEDMIRDLERQDDEVSETDVSYISVSSMPFAAIPYGDSRWLQSHDL